MFSGTAGREKWGNRRGGGKSLQKQKLENNFNSQTLSLPCLGELVREERPKEPSKTSGEATVQLHRSDRHGHSGFYNFQTSTAVGNALGFQWSGPCEKKGLWSKRWWEGEQSYNVDVKDTGQRTALISLCIMWSCSTSTGYRGGNLKTIRHSQTNVVQTLERMEGLVLVGGSRNKNFDSRISTADGSIKQLPGAPNWNILSIRHTIS